MIQVLSGLYVITDPVQCESHGISLLDSMRQALEGGARLVQYRNKLATQAEQIAQAKALRELTREFDALLFINDSIELCIKVDADGAHLGQKDGQLETAKSLLGDRLLGVTCHNSLELAKNAIAHGADYCAFGAVFSSPTKPSADRCSLATIREASKLPVPICAIGGIDADNAKAVIEANADMLAIISGIFKGPTIRASARSLASLF